MRESYYGEPPAFLERSTTPWEESLADTLRTIFSSGVHDLDGIVAALNTSALRTPSGETWTSERFQSILQGVGR